MRFTLRFAALLVLLTFSFNELAHAAHLPGKIAVIEQQNTGAPQTGPIPPQIASAHTIYLANGGADYGAPVSAEQAYSEVATAMRAWGRYQLVDSPQQADLIFQLHEIAPTVTPPSAGTVPLVTSAALQVAIIDPHSNLPIWTVTSPMLLGSSARHMNKWFGLSVNNLISRLKVVAGEPLTPAETKALMTAPRGNYWPFYLMGGLIIAGVGGGLLLKHEFDKNVEKQNQQVCQEAPAICPTTP